MAPPYSKLMSQLTSSSSVGGGGGGGGIDLDGGGEDVAMNMHNIHNNDMGGHSSLSGGGSSSSARSKKGRKKASSSTTASAASSESPSRKSSGSSRSGKAKVRPRLREQEEELLQQVQGVHAHVRAHPYFSLVGGSGGTTGGSTTPATAMMAFGGDGSHAQGMAAESSATSGAINAATSEARIGGAASNTNTNTAMMMSMDPRIMHLQRQIAREAALMATMTSAQQDQQLGQGQYGPLVQGGGQQPAVAAAGTAQALSQGQGLQMMSSQFQGQYQQPMQQQMLPTVGNGISYNAISMTQQKQQRGMNQIVAATDATPAAITTGTSGNTASSASSSVSSSKSSTSLSGDGSSKRSKKKKKRADKDAVPPFFYGKKLRSGVWLQVCAVVSIYACIFVYMHVSVLHDFPY